MRHKSAWRTPKATAGFHFVADGRGAQHHQGNAEPASLASPFSPPELQREGIGPMPV